jgi:hypothetical protein
VANAPASDSIMTAGKMKPLLALSKHKPLQAAIGLTAEGDGVILLHKKAKPKKVLSMLKAAAGKAKLKLNNASLRYGRASVDPEYDPGMVRFFLNKDAPGSMRIKLVAVVKEVPYQKVELNVDPELELEEDDTAESLSIQLAALRQRMTQLPDTDPRKARLDKLATDANVQIKTNNLNYAADFIEQLDEALDEALGEAPVEAAGAAGAGAGQEGLPNAQAADAMPDVEKMRNTLANMQLAIVKVAGPEEGVMTAMAGEIGKLLTAGDLAGAQKLMDELSGKLADAVKAKEAADLSKQLQRLKERIKTCAAPAPLLRALNQLAADADASIKEKDTTAAKAMVRKLTEALDKFAPAPKDNEEAEAEGEELQDAASLTSRLTGAVQRIPQVLGQDPSRKAALLGFATDGKAKIAANDFAGALHAIEELEIALDAPVIAKETISSNTGAVAYGKSRLAWLAVRKQMQGEIEKLQGVLVETYKGTPILGEIQASYNDRVSKKLAVLDESLADLLDDAVNAADPQQRATKAQAARDKIAEYQGFVASESKLFDDLDSNPFVPLAIKATLTKTLATLSAAVR